MPPGDEVVRVAGQRVEDLREELAGRRVEVAVGHARLAEVVDVVEVTPPGLGRESERRLVGPVDERVLHADQRRDPFGVQVGEVVGGEHAEVEAAEDRLLGAEVVEQPEEVPGDRAHVVLPVVSRRGCASHPAHVRSDHTEPRLGDGPDLVPPTEPQVREPVQQHDQRPAALLHVVHVEPVDPGEPVGPFRRHDAAPSFTPRPSW
jgi:hypothetical protein